MEKTDLIYENYKKYEVEIPDTMEFNKQLSRFGKAYTHRFKFENNYGASVIKHFGSYGYEKDLFELAVLRYDENGLWELCYDTRITNDVIGFLTNEQVLELLDKIKEL